MKVIITPHRFTGTVAVPASKSHTIRRLLIAACTPGVSVIERPLDSLDARSCVAVCRGLGVTIREDVDEQGALARWVVTGTAMGRTRDASSAAQGAGTHTPRILDVGNSGTTLFLALALAALGTEPVTFTGDAQISRRSAGPLLAALAGIGAQVHAGPNGCVPITVHGPWKGGVVSIECPTSQYLSALLLAAPLAPAGRATHIDVPLLNERPYIAMTRAYLDDQHIRYEAAPDDSWFIIPGGGHYEPRNGPVPADFSSAAFPGCAAVCGGGPVTLLGLDPADTQGDKAVFAMLAALGAGVAWEDQRLHITPAPLTGGEFDLNACPDLLPVLAAVALYAHGQTALVNVAHARLKETDRIAVMAAELRKLGACVTERPDGLIIQGGQPQGGSADAPVVVNGHGDHRVVMALAIAALGATGPVAIEGAEAAAVTYPGFLPLVTDPDPGSCRPL